MRIWAGGIALIAIVVEPGTLAAPTLASAQSNQVTTISGTLISTDSRLPPDEVRDIVSEAHFRFRLAGKNNVEESISRAVISANGHEAHLFGPDFSANAKLGESGGQIIWRVLGPHRLQRVAIGKQFVLTLDFEIEEPDKCQVSAKFLLQKGTTFIMTRRFDNGEEGRFTLPRVDSASCRIE